MSAGEAVQTDLPERLHKALSLGLAHLNRRERSVAEVRSHLQRKGVDERDADAVIEILAADGYLDDGRYALMYVHDRRQLHDWGSDRIRRELHARGVDRELIEQALGQDEHEHRGGETELERALTLLRRRFAQPPQERRDRDRALGMLIRKGFDSELAVDALTAYAHER